MNIIKQIASRGLIYVLAVAILGSGLLMSSDTTTVSAETLSKVYLTNKGTGKTTEVAPASSRTAPASRANASTVYVTMTDVDTANAVKNSHIIDANKVVITVEEADSNTRVNVFTGNGASAGTVIAAEASLGAGKINVVSGSAGDPVIDTDGDGDLADEIIAAVCSTGTKYATFDGAAFAGGNCAGGVTTTFVATSVANGLSATTTAAPQVTTIVIAADASNDENNDEVFIGYKSSAVNTFQVTAWSTVQLEANASVISVVETGRNTGVFEAEFVVADTEGVNDNLAETMITSMNAGAVLSNTACGSHNPSIVVAGATPADGRFDASSGINVDCEIKNLVEDQDLGTGIAAGVEGTVAGTYTVLAGEFLIDEDGDGSVLDSIYFIDDADATDIANGNQGLLMNVTSAVCSLVADCGVPHTADRTITIKVTPPVVITNGATDVADVVVLMGNNVVDQQKIDTGLNNTVTSADLLTGRTGSDTMSTGGTNGLGTADALAGIFTGTFTTGTDRTPVVEAQSNATITVAYTDTTNDATAASTKIKATVTVDSSSPTAAITSPTNGNSSKERQPTFVGSMTDIGSGLDVSTGELYIDMNGDNATLSASNSIKSSHLAGSWLGGAGSVNLQGRYMPYALVLDNTTTMVDGISSVTWTVATNANIPCQTVSADTTKYPTTGVNTGSSTHTDKHGAVSCNAALADPDVAVDYAATITDLAGNRGYSDSKATTDTLALKWGDSYSINIDEQKPVIGTSSTGKYWDSASLTEKSDSLDKLVVTFNDELSATTASAFQVTTDAGVTLVPLSAEVGTKGTTAAGVAFDKRTSVYLTLPSNMASNDTPKVKVIGDVTDLAGNSTKTGTITNATDTIKPTLTVAVAGGSGTGTGANAADKLTKSAMTVTITTSEVLASPPTVDVYNELYGRGGTAGTMGDVDLTAMVKDASVETFTISGKTVLDTDFDGSLLDEIILGVATTDTVSASQLLTLTVSSVALSGEDTVIGVVNTGSTLVNAADFVSAIALGWTADGNASNTYSVKEGTVSAVAQDSTTYTASFAGSGFTDTSTTDMKSLYVSATDASTSPNTQTSGSRNHAATTAHSFRLDKTAPTLATASSSTTLPRPYVIIEFADNSNVTVITATFGGDDVLAQLATTNNKKYFMIPTADLTTKVYAVKAKATDLAGNKGTEASYNLTVTSRKDYKATILAGWNLMSFPSDPVSNGVGNVFTNAGIDQVVGYNATAKSSPWAVATKDIEAGTYSGDLDTITSGNGYWVHSTEFSSQSVSLTGPEGPSASAPPSIESIGLASGWNLIGVVDATKALTQANEGSQYKRFINYLGASNGSSVSKAYEYDTTSLTWVEINIAGDADTDVAAANIGEAYWVFAKPGTGGLLTPIVP